MRRVLARFVGGIAMKTLCVMKWLGTHPVGGPAGLDEEAATSPRPNARTSSTNGMKLETISNTNWRPT